MNANIPLYALFAATAVEERPTLASSVGEDIAERPPASVSRKRLAVR